MELSGRTGILSLFDLVQMLSVNEATGLLKVERGSEKGYLYFEKGAVINAMDAEHREGEEAARRVFAMGEADFSFAPELPSVAHRIRSSPQSLMMEIARQLDEDSLAEGDEEPGARVREARQATEALRHLFRQLDSDSRILAARSHQGVAVSELLAPLKDSPEAVLHLREGTVPEIRRSGGMERLGEEPLDRRGYEELRDLMLRSATPLGPAGGEAEAFVLSLGGGTRHRVERLRWESGEMLTVRRWGGAPAPTPLPWPEGTLEGALAEPGSIVLLTAPEAAPLGAAFHAAATRLLAAAPGPLLGLARRWDGARLPARAGALLLTTLRPAECAAAADLVERLEPWALLVESPSRPCALRAALRGLDQGARLLLGVAAPSAPGAPARLLERTAPHRRGAWTHHLAAGLRAVLGAGGLALPVSPALRAALAEGGAGALAEGLARAAAAATA